MGVFLFNIDWMSFNVMLALLAVLFGFFFMQTKGKILQYLFGMLWFFFLPNTIYLYTDLQHILQQWQGVSQGEQMLLFMQYSFLQIIGFVTFVLAVRPFEIILQRYKISQPVQLKLIILFNFLIGFGMVLGRIERLNSWEIFTQPQHVLMTSIHTATSFSLLGLAFLFGLVCNFSYFLFRDTIYYATKKAGNIFYKKAGQLYNRMTS
jgi:uncharacterized membrane protein